MPRVAVVTGSNKGIGFGIVRALCKQSDWDVYLTARDVSRGQEAVVELNKEGLKPKFHQLDICDDSSIVNLKQHLMENYGGLDVLVNNAGIAYKGASTAPMSEQAEVSMATNFWGLLNVCEHLFPILKSGARVVHVSSLSGTNAMSKCTPERRQKLLACKSSQEVKELMTKFVSDVKAGKHKEEGWADSCYGTTKSGVTLITPIQQHTIDQDKNRSDIIINSGCPGYVSTEMSSFKGHLTIDQGAETPTYLALLLPGVTSPRGEFVSQKEIVNYRS